MSDDRPRPFVLLTRSFCFRRVVLILAFGLYAFEIDIAQEFLTLFGGYSLSPLRRHNTFALGIQWK
jgi:hypothetical protein